MADLLSIDNFKGMVTDVSDGKQPQGTCKEIKNLVYDREFGSLVTRYTYENSLARPTGVSTLSKWLSFPTTYPDKNDNHIWFTEDGIFIQPYYHNSSTVTNGWAKVTDTLDFSAAGVTGVTITGSATNTFVMTGADAYSFSTTSNYYKNWVLALTDASQGIQFFLIKTYAYSAAGSGTVTLTLDNIIDTSTGVTFDKANINGQVLYRYFHTNGANEAIFAPSFTYPAGYATEMAYRFSGGAGSTSGLKNVKAGYVNRLFFAGSGASVRHQFTGTYIDQAECKAPLSSLLTASSFTTGDSNANVITSSTNYDFTSGTTTNWAGAGNTGVYLGQSADSLGGDLTNGLVVYTDGSDGDNSTNYAVLASTYAGNVTSGTEYTVKIKGRAFLQYALQPASIGVRVIVNSVNYDAPTLFFNTPEKGAFGLPSVLIYDTLTFTFTPNSTNPPAIRVFLPNVSKGHTQSIKLDAITITPTASAKTEIETNNTYKLWATYVYDGFQESEPTYLASKYVTGKFSRLTYELNLRLGNLNKFISGVRVYISQESGDATSTTTTTTAPRYLIRDIPIDDDATSTWVFDTSNGKFEYADSVYGLDWTNRGVTWEQKTGRTQSNSTTCSYFLATQASGRIFIADDYDYSDAQLYVNRVRFTGFNGDGAPTPDIFPNIPDVFITTITAGASQEIRNIVEFEGDVVILKKSSVLRLDTSNPNPFTWELLLIKDRIGSRSSQGAFKFDKGLFFTDLYSAYLYDGYQVRDVLKGKWRNLYQSLVTSDAIAISQKVWYNPVNDTISVAYDTTSSVSTKSKYYEFNTDSWLPVLMRNATDYYLENVVTTSDGVVHFAPSSVGANAFKIATAVGTPLVDISIDTGYYDMPRGMNGLPKWVYILAESPISGSTIVVTLVATQPDGTETTVFSGTFTPTVTTRFLYKAQTTQDIRSTMLKLTMSQTGAVAPSTKQFKLHRVWIEGDLVPELTDVTLLPS